MSKISQLNHLQNKVINQEAMYQPVKVLKIHDDGDATVRIGRVAYVVTTDGRIFREIFHHKK